VLHQVGVSFDLYYDARKHKIKIRSVIVVASPTPTTTPPPYIKKSMSLQMHRAEGQQVLGMEFVSCQLSDARNLDVSPKSLKDLCSPGLQHNEHNAVP